jgi:hypothetical protein
MRPSLPSANGTSPCPRGIVENTVISTFGRLISALTARTTRPFCSSVTSRRLPVSADFLFTGAAAARAADFCLAVLFLSASALRRFFRLLLQLGGAQLDAFDDTEHALIHFGREALTLLRRHGVHLGPLGHDLPEHVTRDGAQIDLNAIRCVDARQIGNRHTRKHSRGWHRGRRPCGCPGAPAAVQQMGPRLPVWREFRRRAGHHHDGGRRAGAAR